MKQVATALPVLAVLLALFFLVVADILGWLDGRAAQIQAFFGGLGLVVMLVVAFAFAMRRL